MEAETGYYKELNAYQLEDSELTTESILQCFLVTLKSMVLCGSLVGLLATFLWWIDLNVSIPCFNGWDSVPESVHRQRLLVDMIKGILLMYWPLVCLAPICSWSTVRELRLFHMCTIAGLTDAVVHALLFIFRLYHLHWRSYIGNVIFLTVTFLVYYFYGQHRQQMSQNKDSTVLLACKLSFQFILGLCLTVPFNYVFLDYYGKVEDFLKVILNSGLILLFFIFKVVLYYVLTNIDGIFLQGEGILFAVTYITATTIVARLLQARIESFAYFIGVSFLHGACSIIDKLMFPFRDKIVSCICKGRGRQTTSHAQDFNTNQSFISVITEATCVIFCSSVAYLLAYYYKGEESTGSRYNGFRLFKEMVERVGTAIAIELVMNMIAMKILVRVQKVPVTAVWKLKWKFIVIVHILQVLFIVLYYCFYLNQMLIKDFEKNKNQTCVGNFKRV